MASNLSDTVSDTPVDGPLPNGVGAVVVAAGSSRRMDGVDKIFAPLAGVPGIVHVLDQLEAFPPLQRIAVVVGEGSLDRCRALVASRGYRKIAGFASAGRGARIRSGWAWNSWRRHPSRTRGRRSGLWSTTAPAHAWTRASCGEDWRQLGNWARRWPGSR